jgi:cytochrome c oxidase subunit II
MSVRRPLTTRRGFIAGVSFSAVSLYGVWAGFGAAPLPFLELAGGDGHGGGHGGHGEAHGPTPDEFRDLAQGFIASHRQSDGSVKVVGAKDAHEGHGAPPAEIYLLAYQWSFEPETLRLERGVPYRFRMMALDVSHGVGLQLGRGSRIIRLPAAQLVEVDLGFARPGDYLVYCTQYCGVPHHRMMGRVVVA